MMLLSPHFTTEEFTITEIRGVDNAPSAAVMARLKNTAGCMEPVRTLLGHLIIVTSGYRSVEVNRRVGGSAHSAHIDGDACDFICPAFGSPLEVARKIEASTIGFDQLIFEETWVHLSFATAMRQQVLTRHKYALGYMAGIIPDPATA